jgi:hypothetical protein
MKSRLLSNLQAGEVIVLHDSGETLGADFDAPKYMLTVLDEFIEEAVDLGYQFMRVDEMIHASLNDDNLRLDEEFMITNKGYTDER